jgi:hypothetical protein
MMIIHDSSALSGGAAWRAQPVLQLQLRAAHFFSECQRVLEFKVACKTGKVSSGATLVLQHLGASFLVGASTLHWH